MILRNYTKAVNYVKKNAEYLKLDVEEKDVKMLILQEATKLYTKEMEKEELDYDCCSRGLQLMKLYRIINLGDFNRLNDKLVEAGIKGVFDDEEEER